MEARADFSASQHQLLKPHATRFAASSFGTLLRRSSGSLRCQSPVSFHCHSSASSAQEIISVLNCRRLRHVPGALNPASPPQTRHTTKETPITGLAFKKEHCRMHFTSSSTEGSHETKQEADRSWQRRKKQPLSSRAEQDPDSSRQDLLFNSKR